VTYQFAPGQLPFFNNGEPVTIHDASAARKFGIAVIFQDFTLVPYLDIGRTFSSAANSRAGCPASLTGAASTPRPSACST